MSARDTLWFFSYSFLYRDVMVTVPGKIFADGGKKDMRDLTMNMTDSGVVG